VKGLILGCGSIGARHARNFSARGVDLVVYDPDASRASKVHDDLGIPAIGTKDDVQFVDICVIATPSVNHVSDLLWALDRARLVFLEKPAGVSQEDIARLEGLSRDDANRVLVGCNLRFTSGYLHFKEALTEDPPIHLAAVFGWYLPAWRPSSAYQLSYSASRTMGGGIVLDAIHELDYVIDLAGSASNVHGQCRNTGELEIDVEDVATILLSHESGVTSTIQLDYLRRNYSRSCTSIGATGTTRWDYARGEILRWVEPGEPPTTIGRDLDRDTNAMYVAEAEHAISCLRGNDLPVNDLGRATETLRVALAARQTWTDQ
jgi:predicted dehydrogenase